MGECGFSVYVVTHVATNRHYVGKATGTPEKRWREHVWDAENGRPRCRIFHRALAKYGRNEFEWRVIQTFATEQEAFDAEAFWIGFLWATVPGYGFNIHRDGVGGWGHEVSEATRAKLRAANLGKKYGPETKAKLSAMRLGRKMPPRSEEWRRKASDARKREIENGTRTWSQLHTPHAKAKLKGIPKTLTPEARIAMKQRVSEQMKARWADPEYRKRYSEKMAAKRASRD